MLRGMVTLLLETGKVDTTLTRAKEVRALAEKMITLGKKNTLASRRQALAFITKEDVVKKVFDQIAPENANRNGGYTAIYKLGPRRGDGAEMARIVLVSEMEKAAAEKAAAEAKAKKGSKKKAAKKEVVEETVEAPVEEAVEASAEETVEAPAEETAEVSAEEVAAVLENALESIDEE
jgi:large subunit ribosomal protein L17